MKRILILVAVLLALVTSSTTTDAALSFEPMFDGASKTLTALNDSAVTKLIAIPDTTGFKDVYLSASGKGSFTVHLFVQQVSGGQWSEYLRLDSVVTGSNTMRRYSKLYDSLRNNALLNLWLAGDTAGGNYPTGKWLSSTVEAAACKFKSVLEYKWRLIARHKDANPVTIAMGYE